MIDVFVVHLLLLETDATLAVGAVKGGQGVGSWGWGWKG